MTPKIVIEDAYYQCCGEKYRDKVLRLEHILSDWDKHAEEIERRVRQERAMWEVLHREGRALWMREKLDEAQTRPRQKRGIKYDAATKANVGREKGERF